MMTAARKLELISVADYLAGEVAGAVKHEYVGGVVFAMAGATNAHNLIAGNLFGQLYLQLRGQPCRPYNSDAKIRIRQPDQTRFYYPDASVVCRPNPPGDTFHDEPVIVFEVLSESTRRVDTGEKREAYQSIASVSAYVLIESERAAVVVYRRHASGWLRELHAGVGAAVPLPEIGVELALAELYLGAEVSLE